MAETAREIGSMADIDGVPIEFSVNADGTVRVHIRDMFTARKDDGGMADLDPDGCEEFTRLYFAAIAAAGGT